MSYGFIRKPDFSNLPEKIDYNGYWKFRGWNINDKLKNREKITLDLMDVSESTIDVGCGNSLLPVKLKEKGLSVDIADTSDLVLKGYEKYGIKGQIMDLESEEVLKLSKNYDNVVLFEVLEHLKYPEKVIKDLSGYTKKFYITVPNSGAYFYRFNLMFKGRFFTQWIYHPAEHLRYWTHIDFLDWLEAQGLEVEKTIGTDGMTIKGMFPNLFQLWKNFLSYRVLYVCKVKKNN